MIFNYSAEAVKQLLPDVLNDYKNRNPKICTCEMCQEDIMALALNRLPPHYVATRTGTIFTTVKFDCIGGRAEVIAAITGAIKQVTSRPRHEREDV